MVHARHLRMIHARHLRMIHACHLRVLHSSMSAHGLHPAISDLPSFRYGRLHSGAGCQRGSRVATAVHGFGEDGVRLVIFRCHQHIVGFRHGNTELIHIYRLHWLTICRYHGHLQAGNT